MKAPCLTLAPTVGPPVIEHELPLHRIHLSPDRPYAVKPQRATQEGAAAGGPSAALPLGRSRTSKLWSCPAFHTSHALKGCKSTRQAAAQSGGLQGLGPRQEPQAPS